MNISHSSPFYVYLNSSDLDTQHISSNTTTSFVNSLSTTLVLDPVDNWGVALHQIQASNEFENKSLEIIKVKTDVIHPTFTQNKTLSIVTRSKYNRTNGRLVYFEPSCKEFFPVRSTHISNISIWLTDNTDRPINLTYGQPTIIVLKFQKMPSKRRSFIVRVQSSDDPKGATSDFQASLPPGLSANPDQKWMVSLNSILYKGKFAQNIHNVEPNLHLRSWSTVEEKKTTKTEQVLSGNDYDTTATVEQEVLIRTEDGEQNEVPIPTQTFSTSLSQAYFAKNTDLFKAFKYALNKHKVYLSEDKSILATNFRRVRLNPLTDKILLSTQLRTELTLSWSWAVMLGISTPPNAQGMVVLTFDPYQDYEFDKPMNYNAWTPNSIFIYANFINYSPIGNVEAPILKIIPIESEGGSKAYSIFESKTDELHDVVFSQLSNIRFQLRRVDGEPIAFEKMYPSDVILSLKFVQI